MRLSNKVNRTELYERLPGPRICSPSAQVVAEAKEQFSATVAGDVLESELERRGSRLPASTCRAISTDGLYVAPAPIPDLLTLSVRADIANSLSEIASARVTIIRSSPE